MSPRISLHVDHDLTATGAPHRIIYAYDLKTEREQPVDLKIITRERVVEEASEPARRGKSDKTRAYDAALLRESEEVASLMAPFLDPATPRSTRQSIVGTFRALGFYDPALLPLASAMMDEGSEDDRFFVASYLADQGDEAARRAVLDRFRNRDLGGLNSLRLDAVVRPLIDHGDSRAAMLAMLQGPEDDPPLVAGSRHLRALAADGDERAHDELVTAAYRQPDGFRVSTVAGLMHLQATDPDEAYFACARLLARHDSPDAMALMLRIDPGRAAPALLDRFRRGGAELRLEIARALRLELTASRVASMLDRLAASEDPAEHKVAAELAGHMPPGLPSPWLDVFA